MVKTRRSRNVLTKKLFRDMSRSAMQFVAIVLLCALGTWVYSGLDGTWRMIELSSETYFTNSNLADAWVTVASATRADVDNLQNIRGVADVQSRFTAELDTPDLGEDVSLLVHAYQDAPTINVPLVRQGEALAANDLRGCLLDEQFAAANHLTIGDSITLSLNNVDTTLIIRGLVTSAEQVITTKDVMPDPAHYGFAILNWDSLSGVPVNELLVTVNPDADTRAVETEIRALLPEALLVTQATQASTQRTRSEVSMFRNLSYVFPLLAFSVAALIVLSTLTRMIENQRTQMGTLKALGYSKTRIRNHYLNYAFVPSVVGALGGLFVGRYMLPDMLYAMETQHYHLPEKLRAPISLSAWGMTALMVGLSVLICLYTYRRASREEAAALLRPKPPKAGSRVILEKWTSLWRKLSFNTKMIVRNIARNKGRVMVAMVGLLCCNMLIICAMGLKESLAASVGDYYLGTVAYDLRVDVDANAGTLESYQNRLWADQVEGVMDMAVSLHYHDTTRVTVLSVLKDDQQLLRLGKNNTLITLPAKGVAISRKLADITGLIAGETVELWWPGENEGKRFTIDMVVDTNIGQTVYMAQPLWSSLHKGAFTPTSLLLKNPSALTVHQLAQADEVTVFKYPKEQYALTMTLLDSTTAVFSLMYGAALGLAFVICYNMGLISFTERIRDYATLKVLGYHQKEIRTLMMNENNLITVVGAALGIAPGIWLTQIVLDSINAQNNVFVAHVSLQSVLLASLITCVFSILIEWLLTRRVRSISMVEALKSVE